MAKQDFEVMVINPGSTHDEVAIFKGEKEVFQESFRYSMDQLKPFEDKKSTAQTEFRKKQIKAALKEHGVDLNDIDAVIGRGGLIHPVPSGVFKVNDDMVKDLLDARYGDHPCNLGGILANQIGSTFNKQAFIADPVVVDEMAPMARYSGISDIKRKSITHCLNQKRVARLAAEELGKPYDELNMVVLHMGGGTSIAAHKKGKMIDAGNGLDGEGPFTPQRAGTLPPGDVAKMCFSGKYTLADMKVKISRAGGLRDYLGTSSLKVIDKYILGEDLPKDHNLDTYRITPEIARQAMEAMSYQAAKEIGAYAAALEGNVDAIVLTGGVMNDDFCVEWIKRRIKWIAPIYVYPGSDELTALRDAALRVLRGEEEAMDYQSWPSEASTDVTKDMVKKI